MNSLAKREYLVVGAVLLLMAVMLVPALQHARAERRDGIRRTEIAERKVLLEQYYNLHNTYPGADEFDAAPHEYVPTERDAIGVQRWYLRAVLENKADLEAAYDAEAGRNYYYRVHQIDGETVYDVCGGGPDCPLE